MPNYLGLDPGQSGGMALVSSARQAQIWKFPDTEADVAALLVEVLSRNVAFCYIENVHSMPKQGVSSSFKFGRHYGFLRGVLTGRVPFEEISPMKWQKAMACMSKGDKNVTKAKAQQLFPKLKITHATADALLLAEFCRIVKDNRKSWISPEVSGVTGLWDDL